MLGYRTEPNLSKYFVQTHGKDQAQAQAQAQTRVRGIGLNRTCPNILSKHMVRIRLRLRLRLRLVLGYRTEPNLSKYFVQTHGKDQAQAQAQAQTRVRV